ncbi:MAG: hypothetical protein EBS47_06505 [Betaproteobacteria bacterium]|jgi:hypothetical protein|nr:hypothetical protein [Betaproteobacteria bacterium]NBT10574.1 hypothetical protein [Betaproteobacteria bacterium]NBU49747.1 hypothetical protein [Betaproteobacteria bacterium]NBX96575.1 hypothetical protein [Betaproteobacteria bacterium]
MFAALAAHPWAYPLLEVVHLVGLALVLGNLVLIELRVFGLGHTLIATDLARLSLILVAAGFGLLVTSGILMFATQAQELLASPTFAVKMSLMSLALCNAAWFHARGSLRLLDATARVQMVISTVLWLTVVAAGRWIAYE